MIMREHNFVPGGSMIKKTNGVLVKEKSTKVMHLTLIALATVLSVSMAKAERYMVVFKDKKSFQQTEMQLAMTSLSLSSIQLRSAGSVQKPFSSAENVVVENSLSELQTLVVNSNDKNSMEALRSSPFVAIVEKEFFHPAPKPIQGFTRSRPWDYSPTLSSPGYAGALGPKTPWGIHAVKAPEAWKKSHYGAGSRVVILDTGVDRDHPAIRANFEAGRDFTGGSAGLPYPEADEVGHGTHVAGTIAASFGSDGFVGVAPQAKFLMGKVCSENGCSNVAVANGINWAIQEKADIVSMSLGGPFGSLTEKRAVEAAVAAGVVVVAASGNDGQPQVSYPAAFADSIAVGACDSQIHKANFSNWGPELAISAPGVAVVSSVPLGTGRESTVKIGLLGKETAVASVAFVGSPDSNTPVQNDLIPAGLGKADDFKNVNVKGKFALIKRGEVTFAEKVTNAIQAGALGVVIYNNADGLMQGAVTQDGSKVAIPVVMIEQTVGDDLKAKYDAGVTQRAIIQTIPTDYASFDGTSMATPHVAGVIALMRAANKSATPKQIKAALVATASPMSPNDQNQNGAGLVNAEAAVNEIMK